jgi:1-acyl-sn-glycerol-3-phosphate acyltransferase
LHLLFGDPAIVLKEELLNIPIWGWYVCRAGMIPIDRGARISALGRMAARARTEIARGRQIVIFPEGTRRAPGAEPRYLSGVAYLYAETGLACVPVALNSGLFWPRRSWRRLPGTVLVEILDPIPPGLDRRAFLARLQSVTEAATARLVQESVMNNQGSATLDA